MNLVKSTQSTQTIQVTPKLASEMLAVNVINRRLRDKYVNELAAAMRRGEWLANHHSIACNTRGELVDGQHRLNAVMRSGQTVKMDVTLGVDPGAVVTMDQGVGRTISDLLDLDTRVAQPLRLATALVFGSSRVTAQQVRKVAATPLLGLLEGLIGHCGSKNKYFSSASIRLAACICIMAGHDEMFVREQYRALVLMDYDALTPASKALMRQVTNGTAGHAGVHIETLARGLRVFDPSRQSLTKIQVGAPDLDASRQQIKALLQAALKGMQP